MPDEPLTRSRIQGWVHAIDSLASAGALWQHRAATLETAADDYLRTLSMPGGTPWHGTAQQTAVDEARKDRAVVIAAADQARTNAHAAQRGVDALMVRRAQALSAIAAAEADRFSVGDDLSVRDAGIWSAARYAHRVALAHAHQQVIGLRARELQDEDRRIAGDLRSDALAPWGTDDAPQYKWTADDLYRGDPKATDVAQDGLGDCYLAGPMGAVADANPQWIRDRITFDPTTGVFEVTLWNGKTWQRIPVSQEDINTNIAVRGGSRIDNGKPDAPLWPAVLETAYAKLKAPEMTVHDGLVTGIRGGYPRDALEALTGNSGRSIELKQLWHNNIQLDREITEALASRQPVIVSTTDEGVRLAGLHCYIIESITGTGADAQVTLRNPWNGDFPLTTMALSQLVGHGIPGLTGSHLGSQVTIGAF